MHESDITTELAEVQKYSFALKSLQNLDMPYLFCTEIQQILQ